MKKIIFLISVVAAAVTLQGFFFKSAENDTAVTKASLGKKLFSEKILSKDSSVSCASCHKPQFGFADSSAFSTGIGGKLTKRNTPSVLNMKNRPLFFWDGRAASLEEQALMPIQNPDEMGLPVAEAVARLNSNATYRKLFYEAFKQAPDAGNLAAAFAAYERTLETSNSRFDDWSNDIKPLSAAEERGRKLFIGKKAKCFDCHSMEDFTDDGFKNIGLFNGGSLSDSGRYVISKNLDDLGKFKTPGLRNVGATAPYMHNGMFKTLEAVLDYYNDPVKFVKDPVNIDHALQKPLGLSAGEKKDIVAFLNSLTDKSLLKKK